MSQDQLGLFDTPPNRRQTRLALAIAALPVIGLLVVLPFSNYQWGRIDPIVPMVDAILFVGGLIIATLLFAQAAVFRSRALIVLASSYTLAALLLIPHILTFPGAFAPDGLLGAGVNTTSWLAHIRRAVMALGIILYVLVKRSEAEALPGSEPSALRTGPAIAAAIGLAVAVTILTTVGHDWLPSLFRDRNYVIHANALAMEAAIFTLFVVAASFLYRNRSCVLDMWLLVSLSGWLVQSLMIATLQGRLSLGYYCLYLVLLYSHLVVMLALITETNRLYARLALSTAAQKRERDARLMSMDAVAGAIAHEIGQPLTAVSLNANAALAWLRRERPDVEMAAKALCATIEAGHRASDSIKSIRAIFAKGRRKSTLFSLNDLVRDTASLLGRELDVENATLRLALDETLPPIRGDRLQLQLVLVNLFANAIESVGATEGRPRRIAVRSTPVDGEDVLLEFSDTGVGLDADRIDHIFDAFYTTKPSGTGLGLALSRTIVEGHGGRLWASPGEGHGATFHLQLPLNRLAA